MFSIFEVGRVEPSEFHPSQGTKIYFQPIIDIKSHHEKEQKCIKVLESKDQHGRKETVQGSKKNGQPAAKKCDEKECKSLAYLIVMVQEEGSRKACALENEEYS